MEHLTLDPAQENALGRLSAWKRIGNFVLGGGAALSLQLDIRKAESLPFITGKKFKVLDIVSEMRTLGFDAVEVSGYGDDSCSLILDGAAVSFEYSPWPLISPTVPLPVYPGISLLGTDDIAALKLLSMGSTGSRKDFFDLYKIYLEAGGFSGEKLLDDAVAKFGPDADYSYMLMGLSYFDEADDELLTGAFTDYSWGMIKAFFIQEQANLFRIFPEKYKSIV